ncbi:glycine--tRNA ligase subunit beta [Merismopedia glauca]|uniref:Glycine--tRNA ligase beta subunit n=1 Tax=Merismopedia glauca CCAP 1448/3 TaxID=1296344 RepID=A0A2T1BZ25_9CYAN|nr:glycine--tRNA ligase subunit beta [Merismopedia glauca]PSB01285.1 glycine--tRNA ligase subunit beta [Merismopedia glauca CCAP 1448/3]
MPSFLLEVGTEELPATFVSEAVEQWRSRIPQSLDSFALSSNKISVYATPRRLAVLITGLPSQQADREEEIKGPPAQAAFKDGQPTPAAIGFARKQGVEIGQLEVRGTDKGDFVFVKKTISGQPATKILQQLVPQWIFGLEGKRLMRWGNGDLKFPRPIRWLVALWDREVLPIELVNAEEIIRSDRLSRTHRVLHPEPVSIPCADSYVESLAAAFVQVDSQIRKQEIEAQIKLAATEIKGCASIYPDLLEEVTNLVEYPTAVVGKFDSRFLELPTEAIATVMVTHQRYFPIFQDDQAEELLPYFITISNGNPDKKAIIAAGNERVIRARLADAEYFYQADLSHSLESYLPKLEKVTFQEELGSVSDKVNRIKTIAQRISQQLNLPKKETQQIQRTAQLCKADLVTQMVGEFPELQGVMGQKYALASGEDLEVATGIFEHYLPQGAGDRLPETIVGQVVGISDRLDTIVSIFGLGMLPTGSSDPFALRRGTNAIINIIWSGNLAINLQQLIEVTAADFSQLRPQTNLSELIAQLQEFWLQRIKTLLQEEKQIDYDLVNAVIGENDLEYSDRVLQNLLDTRDRALFLQTIRNNGTLEKIYPTVNRSTRLAAQGDLDKQQLEPENLVNPQLFDKASERNFYESLIQIVPQTKLAQTESNYQLLVDSLSAIAPVVSSFFDGDDSVLVMDSNPDIKRNRLNLLGLLRNHARILADFGAIVKS